MAVLTEEVLLGLENQVFLFKDEKSFAEGTFDNVTCTDDTLRLDQASGRYVQAGCYTSPKLSAAAFSALVASWNAATPKGTAVEVFVRVLVCNAWSAWMSYGKWSPFLQRASLPAERSKGAGAWLDTDQVRVCAPEGGTAFQLRINLYTNDIGATPAVFLLAA